MEDELEMDITLEAPTLSRRAKAAAVLSRGYKEVKLVRRRATFSWRQLRAGALVFQESHDQGGARRTLAIGRKLGEGGYSTIWRVHEWQPDGAECQFAVKRIVVDQTEPEQVAVAEHEVRVMRSLPPHPNVIELIGTCRRRRGTGSAAQDELFLLLELCRGGSLGEMLMARGEANEPLSIGEAARATFDMSMALAHLHAQPQPLAHRDVKPENFILSLVDGRWRLCDFGSATTATFMHVHGMPSHQVSSEEETVHRYSTPQYRAPEMCDLRRGERVGIAVDTWALGVSLFKLLFMRDLFCTPGEERLAILNFEPEKKLAAGALPRHAHEGGGFDALMAVLHACLSPSPERRPSSSAVVQMLIASAALLQGLPTWEAYGRGGHTAGQITLSHLQVRGLHPKSSQVGVKAYLLITCGGTRRLTAIARRGKDASWPNTSIVLSTHGMCSVEVTVWAGHRRATHDFLGAVSLRLPALIHNPSEPASVVRAWMPLQKRSSSSRASGEFRGMLAWAPYAKASDGVAPSVTRHGPTLSQAPLAQGRCDSVASAASGTNGAGSFWASEAAASSAFSTSQPGATAPGWEAVGWADPSGRLEPQGIESNRLSGPSGAGGGDSRDGGTDSIWSMAGPPLSAPSVAIFRPAQDFENFQTLAAPWEANPNAAPNDAAGRPEGSVSTDANGFWAAFDASPQLVDLDALPAVLEGASMFSQQQQQQQQTVMWTSPFEREASYSTSVSARDSFTGVAQPFEEAEKGELIDDLDQLFGSSTPPPPTTKERSSTEIAFFRAVSGSVSADSPHVGRRAAHSTPAQHCAPTPHAAGSFWADTPREHV